MIALVVSLVDQIGAWRRVHKGSRVRGTPLRAHTLSASSGHCAGVLDRLEVDDPLQVSYTVMAADSGWVTGGCPGLSVSDKGTGPQALPIWRVQARHVMTRTVTFAHDSSRIVLSYTTIRSCSHLS